MFAQLQIADNADLHRHADQVLWLQEAGKPALQVASAEGFFKLEGPVSKGKQVGLERSVTTYCSAPAAPAAAAVLQFCCLVP